MCVQDQHACVRACVCGHMDHVCDEWKGRHQQPHNGACNPSLPPSDGDEEIMRPDSAVCVRVCVCFRVHVFGGG